MGNTFVRTSRLTEADMAALYTRTKHNRRLALRQRQQQAAAYVRSQQSVRGATTVVAPGSQTKTTFDILAR